LGDLIGGPLGYFLTWVFLDIDFCCDQGKCCGKKRYPKKNETKSKTISEYFSIYAGPEYVLAGR